jgi:hypothetical protein
MLFIHVHGFTIFPHCQVPFIIVIKTLISQNGHLSETKCELKIITLLEIMYIVIPIGLHLQRQIQKGVKKWNKNHL